MVTGPLLPADGGQTVSASSQDPARWRDYTTVAAPIKPLGDRAYGWITRRYHEEGDSPWMEGIKERKLKQHLLMGGEGILNDARR
jgi:hypothetical protein